MTIFVELEVRTEFIKSLINVAEFYYHLTIWIRHIYVHNTKDTNNSHTAIRSKLQD